MANHFLVEIHAFISSQMDQSRQDGTDAQSRGDQAQIDYCEGRLEELRQLRVYLADQFDLDTQTYY